ncbi:MAG: acetyl esterase/lipase [Planctomycetota bacterium]|jgi:acetyl esterase/lipase
MGMQRMSIQATILATLFLIIFVFSQSIRAAEARPEPVTWEQIDALPHIPADHRIAYGSGEFQFAELRLPDGEGPFPVVVFVHGGCWLADFDLGMAANLSGALAAAGIASWTPEYRRIGNDGGGWPGTLEDLAASIDHLREIAEPHKLDLNRVVLMGHSAGGHLVLWYAAKKNLPASSRFYNANPIPLKGVVSLAGISDLVSYREEHDTQECNTAVPGLLGGEPKELPERVGESNPSDLLPLGVPIRMVHGTVDVLVPLSQSTNFLKKALGAGDDATLTVIDNASHFDMIAPFSVAWTKIMQEIKALLAL